ncbi:MAG: hypothetical protein WAQ98_09510, partial [Blastocatellia bacterium]
EELLPFYNKKIDYNTVIIHAQPTYYPQIISQENKKQLIGYTVWETDKLPESWLPKLGLLDKILVPCEWNKKVFIKSGVEKPIFVFPHICEEEKTNIIEKDKEFLDILEDNFMFYTIGVWTSRKALFNSITAYSKAFGYKDKTMLVIKTSKENFALKYPYSRYITSDVTTRFLQVKNFSGARIKVIVKELTDNQIKALHSRGDCYISLCRSEGWGLGAFDAATYGKPVMMTGFGGNLDYLSNSLSYLVKCKLVPVKATGFEKNIFSKTENWAEVDISDAVKNLKYIYNNQAEAKQKAEILKNEIKEKFNQEFLINKLLSIIRN